VSHFIHYYAECHYAECPILIIIMLSVVTPKVMPPKSFITLAWASHLCLLSDLGNQPLAQKENLQVQIHFEVKKIVKTVSAKL
jgi:hypothetical protein